MSPDDKIVPSKPRTPKERAMDARENALRGRLRPIYGRVGPRPPQGDLDALAAWEARLAVYERALNEALGEYHG